MGSTATKDCSESVAAFDISVLLGTHDLANSVVLEVSVEEKDVLTNLCEALIGEL